MSDEMMKLLVRALLCGSCKGSGELWRDRGKGEMPERLVCPECGDARQVVKAWARSND